MNRIINKTLVLLWGLAAIMVILLAFLSAKLSPYTDSNAFAIQPFIITLSLAVVGMLFTLLTGAVRFPVMAIFFAGLCVWGIYPVLKFDVSGYPIDVDEYDDIIALCQNTNKNDCLSHAAQRVQNEIKGLFSDSAEYIHWNNSATKYCRVKAARHLQSYQNCLYDVAYRELMLQREIQWQNNSLPRHLPK